MKLIVDAFGGDNAPDEILKGCRMAADELGVSILLTGPKAQIESAAARVGVSVQDMEILDCPDVLGMEEDPLALRNTKKNSSMAVGFRALFGMRAVRFVDPVVLSVMKQVEREIRLFFQILHSTPKISNENCREGIPPKHNLLYYILCLLSIVKPNFFP